MYINVRAVTAAMAVGAMALVAGCAAGTHNAASAGQPGGAQAGARPAASATPANPSETAAPRPSDAACQPMSTGSAAPELTLTTASIGRTYCVRTGDLVRVLFFGLPQAWLPLRLTGDALAPATSAGSATLVPSRPSDLYRAIRPGTATLTASRMCTPLHPASESGIGSAGTSTCLGRAVSFRVVIIVS